jgi:DnaK suppressor protein
MPVKKTSSKKTTVAKKKPVSKKPAAKPAVKAAVKPAAKTAAKAVAKAPVKAVAKKKPGAVRSAFTGDVSQYTDFTPYELKKGEEYMNDAQLRHFVGILRAWKQGLMEEVDRTVGHMKDEATNFPDPNDRATQEEEFNLELRTRDRERKLIKKIDEALESIDDHDYGYCEACGIEIGVRRLEARPTATMCIDCKTLEELKEKQTRA